MENSIIELGILNYPQAQQSAVLGLSDLFGMAQRYLERPQNTSQTQLRISHWQLSESVAQRIYDTAPKADNRTLAVLIVPPSLAGPPQLAAHAPFLTQLHSQGTILASVCVGVFMLAESGLLDGRAATTHWKYREQVNKQFPQVKWDIDKLLVDNGDIITAGGVMAWTDLGLSLVERLCGPACMLDVSRSLLLDPPRQEQRYYSLFSPKLQHGDKAILRVQHWLQEHIAQPLSVAQLAALAGLQLRTFQRRFNRACGLNVSQYCQQLRVTKGCELLQFTRLPIDTIAWQVGYQDSGAFRKLFQRTLGLSPGEYRRRFSRDS